MEARGAGGRRGKRKQAVSKSVKAGLQFPVGRIARFLKQGRYAKRTGTGAPIYLAAVLEYLAAEVVLLFLVFFRALRGAGGDDGVLCFWRFARSTFLVSNLWETSVECGHES